MKATAPSPEALRARLRHLMVLRWIATAVEAIKLGATHYLTKPANADDIVRALYRDAGDPSAPPPAQPMSVDRLEREHIARVLADCRGNIAEAARALSMHRRTLQRKLAKRPIRR